MKTTLVIMAAGIGSRFGGGIKQLAPVGRHGEIIMDYSIHDAIEAGFNKIVFIIRKDIREAFKEAIGDRIQKICDDLGVTVTETLVSFFIVVILGAGLAVLLWCFPRLAQVTEPYLVILNSLPKSALAPLLIVWLGANERTIIVSGVSVAIFGSVLNLYAGFQNTDPDKLKLIETLGGGKKEKFQKIILPSSLPLFLSVMKVNIGLCLVGVIIGEFIGARQGLGYLIIYSSQTFKLTWVLMSITLLCIIALILYGLLGLIEKYVTK